MVRYFRMSSQPAEGAVIDTAIDFVPDEFGEDSRMRGVLIL